MKHILVTLAFFASNEGLHSFAKNKQTLNAVKSLEKRRYLKVYWDTFQAEFTGKVFA
jgi:hypothetical protein